MLQLVKQLYLKTFIKHPWIEAFILSIACHLVLLCFLWFCYEVYVMLFPQEVSERIINIEFEKGER